MRKPLRRFSIRFNLWPCPFILCANVRANHHDDGSHDGYLPSRVRRMKLADQLFNGGLPQIVGHEPIFVDGLAQEDKIR
jgi:hypothetical protein